MNERMDHEAQNNLFNNLLIILELQNEMEFQY